MHIQKFIHLESKHLKNTYEMKYGIFVCKCNESNNTFQMR